MSSAWVLALVVIVGLPFSYALNRLISARLRARIDGEVSSRLHSIVYAIGLWVVVIGVALLIITEPTLWWLWLGLFLITGYAAVVVVVVRRRRLRS
jgi:uncharacterized membrane protein